MPATPRVSVALCTCNGSRFIAEQVDSICRQTLSATEIVLHDDASTDETVAHVRAAWGRWQSERPHATPELRITVHERRLGIAQNFASALNECNGDLIALSDQDDRWHPERLEHLVARMDAQPATLLLHGNARLIGADGNLLGNTLFDALAVSRSELRAIAHGRAIHVLLDRNLVTGATTIFRRSLLYAALPFPAHWLHDEWLGAVAAALGGVDVEKGLLLDYRQHAGNQIGAQREPLFDGLRRVTRSRRDWHTRRLMRAQELEARLAMLDPPVASSVIDEVREKVAHHRARAGFPDARIRRPLPILQELSTGRYQRFGRGLRGVIKDLLESA
jgi:glycosyltransferase involved in cell wall biosynthesis